MTRTTLIAILIIALCAIAYHMAKFGVQIQADPNTKQVEVLTIGSYHRVTTTEIDGLKCGILWNEETPVAMSCVNKMPGLGE